MSLPCHCPSVIKILWYRTVRDKPFAIFPRSLRNLCPSFGEMGVSVYETVRNHPEFGVIDELAPVFSSAFVRFKIRVVNACLKSFPVPAMLVCKL